MYMPVLKVKGGELNALKSSNVDLLEPLLEIVPPKTSEDPVKILKKRAKEIAGAWRHEIRIDVVEFVAAAGEILTDNGASRHVLEILNTELTAHGIPLIPVTGIGRSSGFQTAAAAVAKANGRGAALRIHGNDLTQTRTLLGYAIQAATDLGLPTKNIDIVVDLNSVIPTTIAGKTKSAVDVLTALFITALPSKGAPVTWRQAYVVAGGYSGNPAGVLPGSVTIIPRSDWQLWTGTTFPVSTTYGDYGVDGPAFPASGGRAFSNIKYTSASEWLFIRGENVTQPNGRPTFHTNCVVLKKHAAYRGSSFSAGDAFFDSVCSAGKALGNPTNWRTAMYSHHIATVLDQLRGTGRSGPIRHGPPAPALTPVTKPKGRKGRASS